jgi:tetratricopeptide (TPR) repeat protein
VTEDPQYLWGWRNLAQWYDAEGRQNECLEAAEQMVRLTPDDPVAYGYRGEARRTLGDRVGAKVDFEKAFELDPRFEAAGLHLIVEQIDAGDAEAAARTLARVQEHSEGPLVKSRAVLVAAKLNDLPLARTRFRAAAADPEMSAGLLRDAAAELDKQGWSAEVDEELRGAVLNGQATSAAAAVWTDRLTQRNRANDVLDALPKLFEQNHAAGREAAIGYALSLAMAGKGDQAAATLHRFGDQLRTEVKSWARSGIALVEAKQYALAATWLSDWASRDGVESWMLRPLVDALRALERDPEANAVCETAARMNGAAATQAFFRGWLALTSAIDRRLEDARDWLSTIDRVGLPDGIGLIVSVAEAVVMVGRAGADAKSEAFADAKEHLKTAVGSCGADQVPLGLAKWYKRAVSSIAASAGGFGPKLWGWWQQSRPWLKST